MDPSKLFQETDIPILISRIKKHPLGLLVAVDNDGCPNVTHVPVVVKERRNEVFISFHLTKNNVICKALTNSNECIFVFTGENAYISPDWYDLPDQVPTWNYVSVECKGKIRLLRHDELVKQLDDLSDFFEQQLLPKPIWTRSKMKAGKFDAMLTAIIGFEMTVDNLQGTTKLNQNKPPSSRNKVITALENKPISNVMENLKR